MITSQEIREMTFEKATFGGYAMGGVDDFLDTVANDITLLQKENTTLKGKLKVLANKIEEYRANEEAMKAAMLRLEKLGGSIENDAKARADKIIADAMASASRITKDAQLELQAENTKLAAAKHASAKFMESMNTLMREHAEYLEQLANKDIMREAMEASEVEAEPETVEEAVAAINEVLASVPSTEELDLSSLNDMVQDEAPSLDFNFGE